jgi:D-glycero-beta-D-manno-heptose 1-phosphate adenylyltransferase
VKYLPIKYKIVSQLEFVHTIKRWQDLNESIVFSNGCFDLLHRGHIEYLEKARMLGDRLVLGLNTDRSVKELKGGKRPVQDEDSRLQIMASLTFVDLITLFDESTPKRLIEESKPDILVKGDDYNAKNIVGAEFVMENGGRVETIPIVKGYSTTSLIEKIIN